MYAAQQSSSDSEKSDQHSVTSQNSSTTQDTSAASSATGAKVRRRKSIKSAKKQKKTTPPEKRRVRTGCLTCRSKHKKCDETKPICNFCQSKNLQCIWPQEGMSRPAQLNDTLKQLLSLKNNSADNSITSTINNKNSSSSTTSGPNNKENLNPLGDINYLPKSPDFTINYQPKYLQLPPNFTSILSIIPALQNGNLSSTINSFIFFNDKSVTSTTNSLFSQSLTNLLSNYFLTDPTYILHLTNPNHILLLSRESKSLTYAILAISSRLLEQFDTSYSGENTLDFYILSVRELSKELRCEVQGIIKEHIPNSACTWWTVVLLCWFEIFSVNPVESWGRIKGIFGFFESLGFLKDTKSIQIFSKLMLIPWCCKTKQLENESTDILKSKSSDLSSPTSIPSTLLIDSNIEQDIQKLCSNSKHDIVNLTLQTFFVNDDIKIWVELWNSLLDWRIRSSGNEEFIQPDGAIILAVDKDLFNSILYHSACYHLLTKKPENISLIFQSPNDFSTIIAFAMCQDKNNCEDLIQWHRDRLVKILESNMVTKNKKSIYSACACWFSGFVLNDDKFDKTEMLNLLQKITTWCNLDIFKWLCNSYKN